MISKLKKINPFLFIALTIVIVNFIRTVIFLNFYPDIFIDESFFSLSAIRFLHGKSFQYIVHTSAPWGNDVWAYHSPFFFRMLILPIWLFGYSLFSCRIFSVIFSHTAILLLVLWLYKRLKSPTGALLFSILWIGSYSYKYTLFARPEGMAVFFIIVGFLLIQNALEKSKNIFFFLAGLTLGIAVGFNIATVYFALTGCILITIFTNKSKKLKALSFYTTGGIVSAILFIATWMKDFPKSLEQFIWFVRLHHLSAHTIAKTLEYIFTVGLKYKSFWFFYGLIIISSILLIYLFFYLKKNTNSNNSRIKEIQVPIVSVALFIIAGLTIFVLSTMEYYYLTYSEIWLMLFLSIIITSPNTITNKKIRVLVLILLLSSWLPSSIHNATRFREALIIPFQSENTHTAMEINKLDTPCNKWYIEPKLFVLAEKANLDYYPLPWFKTFKDFHFTDNRGIIVGDFYYKLLNQQTPEQLAKRKLITILQPFKNNRWYKSNIYIYGPVKQNDNTKQRR